MKIKTRVANEKQSSISYSMWTLVKTNCVANQKPKLPSKALNSNVSYNYFSYIPISVSLNISGSCTITIQTHFFTKNYLSFRFNKL